MNKINRREFLSISALAAAGVAAAACAKTPEPTPMPKAEATATPQPTEAAPDKEAPQLVDLVKQGSLPALDERLPEDLLAIEPLDGIGEYGGIIRGVHPNPQAFYEGFVNTAEFLLTWTPDETTVISNLAASWEDDFAAGTMTLNLRKGVKWSDAEPWSADDIMFWWEDVRLNEELTPAGIAASATIQNVEKLDDYTIRISYVALDAEASMTTNGCVLYPLHWKGQYHKKYADKADLDALMKEHGVETWVDLFNKMPISYSSNYGQAVLPPPVLMNHVLVDNELGSVTSERNPYYWKVDSEGNQLPYLDGTYYALVADKEAGNLKIIAGEVDFEGRQLTMVDYALLRQNEDAGGYDTYLWPSNVAGNICMQLNQCHEDPVKDELFSDLNFRIALSIGLDREEFNEVLFKGQGLIMQPTTLPGTPWYVEEAAQSYIEYEPEKANQMLDDLGLDQVDDEGYRLGPDGKPLTIVFEYWDAIGMGEASELVADMWRTALKLRIMTKSQERQVRQENADANRHDMTCWVAANNTTAEFLPYYMVANWGGGGLGWGGGWNRWLHSDGAEGCEPREEMKKQYQRWQDMNTTRDKDEQTRLGKEINISEGEWLWSIGTVSLGPVPLVVSKKLINVPREVPVYTWGNRFCTPFRPESWSYKT